MDENTAWFMGNILGLLMKIASERKDVPINSIQPMINEEGNYSQTIKIQFGEHWYDLDIMPGDPPTPEELGRKINRG